MGFPPLLNLSTRLSTAALPGQTTKMAQTLESMFKNVAYRPTVYRTGGYPSLESIWNLSFIDSPLKRKKIPIKKDIDHRATVVSKRRVELRSLKERKNDKWSSKQVLKHKNVPL